MLDRNVTVLVNYWHRERVGDRLPGRGAAPVPWPMQPRGRRSPAQRQWTSSGRARNVRARNARFANCERLPWQQDVARDPPRRGP